MVEDLYQHVRIVPIRYEGEAWVEELTPNVPRDGVRVKLRLENTGQPTVFLGLQASSHKSEPDLQVDGRVVSFTIERVTASESVTKPIEAIKANIDRRRKDIERGGLLRENLGNVVR